MVAYNSGLSVALAPRLSVLNLERRQDEIRGRLQELEGLRGDQAGSERAELQAELLPPEVGRPIGEQRACHDQPGPGVALERA